jgi:hypothetical protein
MPASDSPLLARAGGPAVAAGERDRLVVAAIIVAAAKLKQTLKMDQEGRRMRYDSR